MRVAEGEGKGRAAMQVWPVSQMLSLPLPSQLCKLSNAGSIPYPSYTLISSFRSIFLFYALHNPIQSQVPHGMSLELLPRWTVRRASVPYNECSVLPGLPTNTPTRITVSCLRSWSIIIIIIVNPIRAERGLWHIINRRREVIVLPSVGQMAGFQHPQHSASWSQGRPSADINHSLK